LQKVDAGAKNHIQENKKKLAKAETGRQVEFVKNLKEIEISRSRNGITLHVDESHVYCELDCKRTWCRKGEDKWVDSSSPGKRKVSLYGAVCRQLGEIFLWRAPTFNSEQTAIFLRELREKYPGRRLDVVWDGGSQHKGDFVKDAIKDTGIHLLPLPPYSPDLSDMEPFWRYLKKDVKYNRCHEQEDPLWEEIYKYEQKINRSPSIIKKRCKPNYSNIRHLLNLMDSESRS
jgi:transposase